MRLLIDASALLNIIKLKGANAVEYLRESYILTLTPYEVGNGLWKEAVLLKTISIEEALALIGYLRRAYKIMRFLEPKSQADVLRLACELGITYYDSAYIVASAENELVLVTDDEKLARKIGEQSKDIKRLLGKDVRCLRSRDLLSWLPRSES